ncbi:MAG: hypothetical protein R3F38_09235 [Gammaproteobacteria bacterium]
MDLRRRLALEVRDILKQQGITGLLVTHDQEEAFAVSDKVGVMRDGVLQQWDDPYTLYHEPANRFVASFIGLGRLSRAAPCHRNGLPPNWAKSRAIVPTPREPGTLVDVPLRPDGILPDPTSPTGARSCTAHPCRYVPGPAAADPRAPWWMPCSPQPC